MCVSEWIPHSISWHLLKQFEIGFPDYKLSVMELKSDSHINNKQHINKIKN